MALTVIWCTELILTARWPEGTSLLAFFNWGTVPLIYLEIINFGFNSVYLYIKIDVYNKISHI